MNSIIQNFKKGFSTFDLKVIGIILMLIDHLHQMFVPFGAPNWLDWFGRPVATIFFFVSVVGFSHTHNKRKYMLRLYTSMVLMSLFTFSLEKIVHYDQVILTNNIFHDLFIGTIFMLAIDKLKDNQKPIKNSIIGISLFILPFATSIIIPLLTVIKVPIPILIGVTSFVPSIALTENNLMVLLIPLMYLFRDNLKIQCLLIALTALIYGGLQLAGLMQVNQWLMIFAAILIWFYNNKKGPGIKYFFYIFYPAHIGILYLISAFLYIHH
ncbi:TraX family protein [Bombilactobacillus thymidiniphilus]|uniref:Conjugal transfer protein TraX n=1 Tax=Bombilactobacillus thymidiniphilus TaxID=2923363 RepID=A0ABY4PFC2_9LACO|nr:TraX family protein [Bombilactobacillus thymidiniphilus]UQS84012.1 conjugal transfer protein TraX [Bombilactobacillus thymidiniphilus]